MVVEWLVGAERKASEISLTLNRYWSVLFPEVLKLPVVDKNATAVQEQKWNISASIFFKN